MQNENTIFIIGCGAVAQCSIPLIIKHVQKNPANIVVIDCLDKKSCMQDYIKQGIRYEVQEVTEYNYSDVLKQYLKPDDICIDLANAIDTCDVLAWCQKHRVRYVNTCLNVWPSKKPASAANIQQHILQMIEKNNAAQSTAILAHGANPGLISSFAKQALVDYAYHFLQQKKELSCEKELEKALTNQDFKQLAFLQNIQVIHVSEKDTQAIPVVKKPNHFLNTWSVVEFIDEFISNVEFSWGTHEIHVPLHAIITDHNIVIKKRALTYMAKSWLPDEEFVGFVVPHDEAFTIADFLTIKENNKVIYRPTCCFVYSPCRAAQESLAELIQRDLERQHIQKVITGVIQEGKETMGSLLLSNTYNGWWTGSILSAQETNELVPHQNATVLQVAAGVLAALEYILCHPHQGILFPEDLNHQKILQTAQPYLGTMTSKPVSWKPSDNGELLFKYFAQHSR